MGSIYDRWADQGPAFITYDPTKTQEEDSERPFHQVYGDRTRKPGLILDRAYALSRQGRWERMRSYLVWELAQPVYGDSAMDQVRELHYTVRNVDSIDQLTRRHMTGALIRYNAGYPETAIARLGWLLELIPPASNLHTQVSTLAATLTHLSEES